MLWAMHLVAFPLLAVLTDQPLVLDVHKLHKLPLSLKLLTLRRSKLGLKQAMFVLL
jgi:hypothetical protein